MNNPKAPKRCLKKHTKRARNYQKSNAKIYTKSIRTVFRKSSIRTRFCGCQYRAKEHEFHSQKSKANAQSKPARLELFLHVHVRFGFAYGRNLSQEIKQLFQAFIISQRLEVYRRLGAFANKTTLTLSRHILHTRKRYDRHTRKSKRFQHKEQKDAV